MGKKKIIVILSHHPGLTKEYKIAAKKCEYLPNPKQVSEKFELEMPSATLNIIFY